MKALVIYKKSQYQIYVEERKNAHIEGLIKDSNDVVKGMLASHEQHNRTLDEVVKTLEKEGISTRTRYRAAVGMTKDADIVFTVGGDGTMLWTQKYVGADLPVFGVNSDPPRSVGALCAATGANFKDALRGYLKPTDRTGLRKHVIERMSVFVNSKVVTGRVLNDVLFCHKHPAAVTNYVVKNLGEPESQKSSGVWVCTPIGSTGAMKSAGGSVIRWTSGLLQWRVREPYEPGATKYTHRAGFIEPSNALTLQSKMREGMLALDGSSDCYNVQMGDVISFCHSHEPLTMVK